MLWPHKNHLRLLEALAYLKDKFSLVIHLVCTGARGDFWPTIESAVNRLELQDQVKFLGIVSREELQALYGLCNFVVVPTLFEAASGPVFEAWNAGAPVACSNVTSLPQQVGKAALVFDPYDVTSIAHAMKTLNSDLKLKADLIARGHLRLRDFSWERTARAFRAVYRRAARRPLTEDEEILLSHDWMSEDASLLG
jgi:glycosyltransferase involved in cell wall biosynthesis